MNKVIEETFKTRIGSEANDSSLNRSNTGRNSAKRIKEFTKIDRFICCKKSITS
jgi:hypothetical protein